MQQLNETLAAVGAWASALWGQALTIWSGGGWAMLAIALIAMLMFAMGLHLFLSLRATRTDAVPERVWRTWIDDAGQRQGPIGDMLDFVVDKSHGIEDTAQRFAQLRSTELPPFQRDLKIMRICVSAAPLVGLLGTVMGMLSTFDALSSGSGGDQTMGLVAAGISEALITTETGLVIALPGLFFQYQMVRKFERYKAFLAHLETLCTQSVYRRKGAGLRLAA